MLIHTKSVEYRLHIRRGKRQGAKGAIDNQFLITRFSMRREVKISDYRPKIIDAGDIYAFYSVSASATKLRIATAGKNRVVVMIAAANPRR
jgi:hypothetical protein